MMLSFTDSSSSCRSLNPLRLLAWCRRKAQPIFNHHYWNREGGRGGRQFLFITSQAFSWGTFWNTFAKFNTWCTLSTNWKEWGAQWKTSLLSTKSAAGKRAQVGLRNCTGVIFCETNEHPLSVPLQLSCMWQWLQASYICKGTWSGLLDFAEERRTILGCWEVQGEREYKENAEPTLKVL